MMHDWKDLIQPFFYVEGDTWASVCLNVSEYKDEIFQTRADEGAVSKSECNTVNELMQSHYRSTPSLCS